MNRDADGRYATTVSDWSFFQDIRRVTDELGHVPTVSEYNEHGHYWSGLASDRANGWLDAIERAGLDPDDRDGAAIHNTPNLPVNPDRDYCDRCGRSGAELTPVRAGGQAVDVCPSCIETLHRRSTRGSIDLEVGRA